MVQYEPLAVMIFKCFENVKTSWDNIFIIVIVIACNNWLKNIKIN